VGEVFVQDAQGLRVERPGCGSAEGAQADSASDVGGAVEKVSGGYGMTAGVGEIAGAQLRRGKVNEREDADPAGGGGKLIAGSSK
jgi:hypothetical protein